MAPSTSEKKKAGISVQVDGVTAPAPKEFFTIYEKDYGERHFVKDGEGYKEVTKPTVNPVRLHVKRNYAVLDSGSFIAYVKRYGNPNEGIISYCQNAITMFFSEANREENIVLNFLSSLERSAFLGTNGNKQFYQKDMIRVLETFGSCIVDQAMLLAKIEKLKMEATIEFESNVSNRDHILVYAEKGGSQTTTIPKNLTLRLPYFEGSVSPVDIEIDFDIAMPKSADQKAVFTITDPRHERTYRDAFEAEVKRIKEGLPKEWMFINGKI